MILAGLVVEIDGLVLPDPYPAMVTKLTPPNPHHETSRYRPPSPMGDYPYTKARQVPKEESVLMDMYKGQGVSVDFVCKPWNGCFLSSTNNLIDAVDETPQEPTIGRMVDVYQRWCDESGLYSEPHMGLHVYWMRCSRVYNLRLSWGWVRRWHLPDLLHLPHRWTGRNLQGYITSLGEVYENEAGVKLRPGKLELHYEEIKPWPLPGPDDPW